MDRDDALLDYLQGKLAPEDRERFEAEMARDPALASEVTVMRAVRTSIENGPRHERAEAVWDRLTATMDAPPKPANQNRLNWTQLARYAAVAVLAVVTWQVAVEPLIGGIEPVYQAATEADAGFTLQVRFADDAVMSDINDALSELQATITDGPSALGLVRLSFEDEALQQQALEALRRRAAIVDFVQAP